MMSESLRAALLACLIGIAMVSGTAKCIACTSNTTQLESVRTALDVAGAALAPSYDLAMKGCLAREHMEIAAERDGKQTEAETDEAFLRIRRECDQVRAGFEALRRVHTEAAAAYERGDVHAAHARLATIKARWLAFTGGGGDAGVLDGGAP